MQRLAFLSMPLLLLSTPAASADLDGPVYQSASSSATPPPVIVERHIYVEEPEVYDGPRIHTCYDRSYGYGYAGWRPRHFLPRAHYWHRHRDHHW